VLLARPSVATIERAIAGTAAATSFGESAIR
jgi:hypothetical protein